MIFQVGILLEVEFHERKFSENLEIFVKCYS
jgi:hypothetical protein